MKVELGKEYRTKKDKYRVELVADGLRDEQLSCGFPFAGIVYTNTEKRLFRYSKSGSALYASSDFDLIEVKPPVVIDLFGNAARYWRPDKRVQLFPSEDDARYAIRNESAFNPTIATFRLKLTIEEGRLDYPLVEATIGGAE